MDKSSKFPRREFLRGAGGAIGLSLLSTMPAKALGRALSGGSSATATLAYWNGSTFIPASQVAGDATLQSVKITFAGYGKTGALRAVQIQAPVPSPAGVVNTPFLAWVAPPRGLAKTQIVAGVQSGVGLTMNVLQASSKGETSTPLVLSNVAAGTYVLFPGTVDFSTLRFNGKAVGAPVISLGLASVPPQYVVLTVA